MNRRSFLRGLGAVVVAAPAIVRIDSLMPLKALWPTDDWGILQRCLDLGLPFPARDYEISKSLKIKRSGQLIDFSGTKITMSNRADPVLLLRGPLENVVIKHLFADSSRSQRRTCPLSPCPNSAGVSLSSMLYCLPIPRMIRSVPAAEAPITLICVTPWGTE